MDSDTQEIFYQKMKEFIFDEEKIVTWSSLIADLTVSITEAKSLLKLFVRDHRQLNSGALGVTYLLAGLLKNENKLCVSLCQENELDDKKSLFSKVSSEDVYSIQKNKSIDYNCIGLVNKSSPASFEDAGFILSKNFVKRSLKKREIIVEEKPTPAPAPSTSKQKQNNFFTKSAPSSQKATPVLQSNNKEAPQPKKPISKAKPGGITNFFNKAPLAPIDKVNKENKNIEEKKEIKVESQKNSTKIKNEPPPNVLDVMEIDDDDVIEVKEKSVAKPTKSDTPNKKKRKKSGKNEAPAKKRKRIQQVCDSDSSDMFDDPEDDVIEKSDEEPPGKVEVKPSLPLHVKGKKRKAVDKTFMDEEGFLVTSTEYVYETASEDEVEVILPKPEPKAAPKPNGTLKKHSTTDSETDSKETSKKTKNGKKKGAPPANQPTLMNFFKKK